MPASTQVGHDNSIQVEPVSGNKSFVLQKVGQTTFEEREVPTPGPMEVQVNIRQTGICGSDVHYLTHGRIGDFVVRAPMVLGHESAGIVTAVGSEVKTHKVGDRVALEPGVPCFTCSRCKDGMYNQCQSLIFAATPPYDGTLATYYLIHSSFAHIVPDELTLEEASLMEPLSVAVYAATQRGQVRAMEDVVVFGAGSIGLLAASVCKAYGAKSVTVVDIVDDKLALAKDFAATHIFKPSAPREGEEKTATSERNAEDLIKLLGHDVELKGGVDLVLECTGAPPCITMGLHALRPQGRFVQVGMGAAEVVLPIAKINIKELQVTGSFRYGAGAYATAISLVATRKVDVARIVTHRYTFDDTLKAFEATKLGQGEDGKKVVKVQISQGEAKPKK